MVIVYPIFFFRVGVLAYVHVGVLVYVHVGVLVYVHVGAHCVCECTIFVSFLFQFIFGMTIMLMPASPYCMISVVIITKKQRRQALVLNII